MTLFGGMMKRFGPAVTISILIHGALAIAFAFWLAYTKIEVVHQVVSGFWVPLRQEFPKTREVPIKPEVLPQVSPAPAFALVPQAPREPAFATLPTSIDASMTGGGGGVGGAPRTIGTGRGIGGAVGIGKFAVESNVGLGYTGSYRSGVSTQMVNIPGKILGTAKVSPGVVTDLTVTTPGDLTYTGPSGTGTGVGGGTGFGEGTGSGIGSGSGTGSGAGSGTGGGRGLVGVQAKVPRGIATKLPGISAAEAVSAAEASTVLNNISQAVVIGNEEVPPLPKGEPGGIIIGRGKDIKGRLHLVRIDDPSDPAFDICGTGTRAISFCAGSSYLVKYLNETTGIKASIEGAIRLTDSALFKAPIIFIEPIIVLADKHDSHAVRSLASLKPLWMTQGLRNKYSQPELANLRQYLLEKGGFMYVLAHGNSEQTLRGIRNLLSEVLPEHGLQRVPNDHEIYSCYYELGGPLRFPVRDLSPYNASVPLIVGQFSELLGVFVNNRLCVLVDTEASMHILDIAVRKSFYGQLAPKNNIMIELASHAARELTNIIIYAMTHGKISDYKDYVPEIASDKDIKITNTAPTIPSEKF